MAEVGKDIWVYLVQHLFKQGHPEQVADVQVTLEIPKEGETLQPFWAICTRAQFAS